MSLGEHLNELRRRLMIAAAAILATAVAGFIVAPYVLSWMSAPVKAFARSANHSANLTFSGVTTAFDLQIQIALTIAIVAASPIWLYQIWAFLVPGLVRKEKVYALSFLLTAIPLFFAGCAAGWFVMPHIVQLMLGFVSKDYLAYLNANDYYDFILKLLIATGVAFVLPVFLVLLNFVRVLSAKTILKGWRVALILICVFTAIATPAADVLSMFLLAVPMVMLYFGAAAVAMLHDRQIARREAQLEGSLAT